VSAWGLEDYKFFAQLLCEGDRLDRLREQLERDRWHVPLFDTKLSVSHLETAARLMWEVKSASLSPRHIVVANSV